MDAQLRVLEKQVAADPGDLDAQRALRSALRRVADLGDRRAWERAEPAAQDAVLAIVGRRLGDRLRLGPLAAHEAAQLGVQLAQG